MKSFDVACKLNRDWQIRLSLIVDYIETYQNISNHPRSKNAWEITDGGSIGIFELPLSVVESLLDQKFLDPKEKQPDGLNAREITNFMRKWQEFGPKAVGYAVSHLRPDYRVTLTGAIIENTLQIPITQDLRDDFKATFGHLTYCEITPGRLYSDQD